MAAADAIPAAPIRFRRILVTGGDGFVGRHLVPALAARLAPDARITLATRTPGVDPADHREVALDLADAAGVARAVAAVRPDLLVHLAAQASVGDSRAGAADTWSINLGGTLALARAVAGAAADCTVFFVSSAEVYGAAFNRGVATEATRPAPQSAYARSKLAAEAMLADVLPDAARLIVVRPSNHSGPGQDERFVIPAFAAQIAAVERGRASAVRVGNLAAERDVMDVRDVVAGYLALLERADALPARSLFNLGSGTTRPIAELLDRLRAMATRPIPVEQDPARMRPSEVTRAALDVSLLRDATGWRPVHGLAGMLADVLAEQRRLAPG